MQGQGGALAWKRSAAWSGQASGPESGPGLPAAFRANKRSRLDEDAGGSWQETPAGCNGSSGSSWDAQAAHGPPAGGDSSWSGHCDSSSSSWAAAPSGGGAPSSWNGSEAAGKGGGGGGYCGRGVGGSSWGDLPRGDGPGSWPCAAGKGGSMSWAGGGEWRGSGGGPIGSSSDWDGRGQGKGGGEGSVGWDGPGGVGGSLGGWDGAWDAPAVDAGKGASWAGWGTQSSGDWSGGAASEGPQQSPLHSGKGPPQASPRQWQQAGVADSDGGFGTMQQTPWQPPSSQDPSAGWGQPSMQQASSPHQPEAFDQQHPGMPHHQEEHGGPLDPSQSFYDQEGGYPPEQMRQWQLWQSWGQARAKGSSAASPLNLAFHGTNVIPTQSQEEQLMQGEGKRYLGRIKRFFGGKASGYGFIDCPEARHRFGYDVYLHAKQMHGCEVGEFVSFTIVRNAKGEPQARNLVRAVEAANVEAKRQAEIIKQQEMLQAKRGGNMFSGVTSGGGMEMDEEAARKFQESLKSRRM